MAKKPVDPKIQARETAEIVEDAFRNVSSEIGKIFSKALDQTESFAKTLQKDVTGTLNSLAKTSTVIEEVLSKQKLGQLKLADIEKIKEQRAIKLKAIQLQFNIAQKNAVGGSIEQIKLAKDLEKQINEAKIAEEELNEELNKFGKQADKNNKKLGITGAVLKGFTKIPILGGLIDSEKVLARIQKKTAEEGSTKFGVFKEGVKGVGSSIKDNIMDPVAGFSILTKVIQFFIDAMFAADKRVTDITKNLSISKDNARGLYDNIKNTKTDLDTAYKTTANLSEAFNDISQLTGFAAIATNNQLETQIVLTKQLGQSKEEALGLQEIFAVNNIEADKGVDIVYDQIAAFGNQNKIVADGRKILTEVSKTSKLIQLNFKGNTPELVKTVLEAKKLGLTLDQVNKTASSLLNFEQSISDELNAELLLGQDINLDKAREYALTNDIAGLTKEIAKQGITAEKFSKLNRIQQEAIAKVFGMQAEELADSLYKQEVINKVAGDETKNLREQAALLRQKGDLTGAINLENQAAAIEEGILKGKNLQEAQKSVEAQEKFNLALERAKDLFADMVNGELIEKLISYIDRLVGSLETGKSLFNTLVFGPASEGEIAQSRKSSLEEKLKTTSDKNEKEKLQLKIAEQEGIIKKEKLNDIKSQLDNDYKIKKSNFIEGIYDTFEESPGGKSLLKKYETEGLTPPKLAEGGIIPSGYPNDTYRAQLSSGEAVIPLNQLMAKLDAIAASNNRSTPKIYLGTTELNTATAMNTYALNEGVTS